MSLVSRRRCKEATEADAHQCKVGACESWTENLSHKGFAEGLPVDEVKRRSYKFNNSVNIGLPYVYSRICHMVKIRATRVGWGPACSPQYISWSTEYDPWKIIKFSSFHEIRLWLEYILPVFLLCVAAVQGCLFLFFQVLLTHCDCFIRIVFIFATLYRVRLWTFVYW